MNTENEVLNEGAYDLAQALKVNTSLHTLNLSGVARTPQYQAFHYPYPSPHGMPAAQLSINNKRGVLEGVNAFSAFANILNNFF